MCESLRLKLGHYLGSLQKYRGIEVDLLAAAMVENTSNTRIPKGINYFHFKEISGS